MTTSESGNQLCVNGLQHAFVLTSWNAEGATSYFANELLCPTCSTLLYRDDSGQAWRWADASDPE